MNYDLLALVLLIVGCGLIVAEIFLPSGGMISVMCVIAFLGSGWCAYRAWWETSPAYWWTYVGAVIVLIPTVIISLFRVLSNTSLGDRVLLAAPDPSEVTPYREEEAHLSQLIGKQGRTLTLLTPGGLVEVEGERLHCFSDGMVIEPQTPVEVVAVRGTRVMVRRVDPDARPTDTLDELAAAEEPPPSGDSSRLDFDVPQG